MEFTGLTKMGCPPIVYNGDPFELSASQTSLPELPVQRESS